jgi:transketolase
MVKRCDILMQRENAVSTVKSPEEKKFLSLARDRRNRYGENSKSSRRNIPRAKQRRHMDERRAVGEVLGRLKGDIQEDEATDAELSAKTRITVRRRRGFKKTPDTPLGVCRE